MSGEWQSIQQYITMNPEHARMFQAMLRQGVSQQQALQVMQRLWSQAAPFAGQMAQSLRSNPAAVATFTVAASEATGTSGIVVAGTFITTAMLWEIFAILIFCLVVCGIVYWGIKEAEHKQRLHRAHYGARSGARGLATAEGNALLASLINDPQFGPMHFYRKRSLPNFVELAV